MKRARAILLAASAVVLCVALVTAGALVGHLATVRVSQDTAPPVAAPAPQALHVPPAPAALGERARGLRVSHLHGRVPWSALARSGLTFAFARASAGTGFVDPEFAANWEGMREAGIVRGAYHVWREDQDAAAQAEHFLATVPELSAADLPPALLVDAAAIADAGAPLARWLERVQARLGRRPIVRSSDATLPGTLEDYPLWRPGEDETTGGRFTDLDEPALVDGREARLVAFAGDAEGLRAFISDANVAPAQAVSLAASDRQPSFADPPPGGLEGRARGVEVTRYQGRVSWPELERAGVAFALIGATGGQRFVDPEFASNWHGARERGIVRAAYHVFYADQDALAQAEHFVATVGPLAAGDLPGVLVTPPGRALGPAVQRWLARVEDALGGRPILQLAASERAKLPAALAEHPVWVTGAAGEPPAGRWSFWRYAETGAVPGISGKVPVDAFDGSSGELAAFAKSLRVARAEVPPDSVAEAVPGAAPAAPPETPEPARTAPPVAASTDRPALPATVPAPSTSTAAARTHTVERGETLYRISRRYGVTVQALMQANGIEDPTTLATGATLAIP